MEREVIMEINRKLNVISNGIAEITTHFLNGKDSTDPILDTCGAISDIRQHLHNELGSFQLIKN